MPSKEGKTPTRGRFLRKLLYYASTSVATSAQRPVCSSGAGGIDRNTA